MVEGRWHKKVREELLKEYGKEKTDWSHGGHSISIFNGRISKENLISNPDIIVYKDKSKKIIKKVIEIEDSANPKKLLSDVFITRMGNTYKIGKTRHKLSQHFQLQIIYNGKKDKLNKIKRLEKEIKKKWKNLNFKFIKK